jgi:hypothetical protein
VHGGSRSSPVAPASGYPIDVTLLALVFPACSRVAALLPAGVLPGDPPATADTVPPAAPAPAAIESVDPNRIERIAVGESTTCVVRGDGTTQCRGKLPLARVALGGPPDVSDHEVCTRGAGRYRCLRKGIDRVYPTAFVELTRGAGAPCGRDGDGGVYCFYGQDEDGATLRPVELPGKAVRVVADGFREYALLDDGRLFGWDPYDAMLKSPPVHLVDEGVVEIDATYLWTCWRTDDDVVCRGEGKARKVRGLDHPDQLTVGRLHACVLQGGVPWCWGDGRFGQLGQIGRRRSSRESAVRVEGIEDAVSIDAGDDHTCVLLDSGDVSCWGRNNAGQVAGLFP